MNVCPLSHCLMPNNKCVICGFLKNAPENHIYKDDVFKIFDFIDKKEITKPSKNENYQDAFLKQEAYNNLVKCLYEIKKSKLKKEQTHNNPKIIKSNKSLIFNIFNKKYSFIIYFLLCFINPKLTIFYCIIEFILKNICENRKEKYEL